MSGLPWLKQKPVAGLIISQRKPDGSMEPTDGGQADDAGSDDQALISAADDLQQALASKDSSQIAQALRAAFQILSNEPEDESPSEDQSG